MADYDVIVVGGGGVGYVSALMARESGASALVVEAADRPGGARQSGILETCGLTD